MKNKILKNVAYLAVLVIVLAASSINLEVMATKPVSCSGGEYINRAEQQGSTCICNGVIIQQKSCSFEQFSTCNSVQCY
jgi:hypothetical protein